MDLADEISAYIDRIERLEADLTCEHAHQQKIEKFSLCFGKTHFFSVASVASLASVASVASLSFPNNTTFFRCFPKLP
jgi:hypothetical protein